MRTLSVGALTLLVALGASAESDQGAIRQKIANCSPYQCFDSKQWAHVGWVWCGEYEEECEFDSCEYTPGSNTTCCIGESFPCCPNGHGGRGRETFTVYCDED